MQRRIPTVIMRGGTSRALFFQENHLPSEKSSRDHTILTAFGSPDPDKRQIDGLGGAVSSTSKVAIISPSADPQYDVIYNFGQVSIDRPTVDYKGNCGNISSAVGPYAVDQGLVRVEEPITQVRIHQANTDKLIVAHVPVKDGRFDHEGDYAINGVPGTGNRIYLQFYDPGGAVSGELLPSGNPRDTINVPDQGDMEISLVDAANPCVFVRAADLGLSGAEIAEVDENATLRKTLEHIRCRAAVMCGLAATVEEAAVSSQAVPKVAFVAPPLDYTTVGGHRVEKDDVDMVVRLISMGALHKAMAVTGAICCAGAARIPGTIVNECMGPNRNGSVRIGHPGGIISVSATVEMSDGMPVYKKAAISRTARRLMEGYVFVPDKLFSVHP